MSPVILDPFLPLLATHLVLVGDEVEESTSQEAFPIGATLDQPLSLQVQKPCSRMLSTSSISSKDVGTLLMTLCEVQRNLSSHEHKSNRCRG